MTASGAMLQISQPRRSPMGTFTAFAREKPGGTDTDVVVRVQDNDGNEAWMPLTAAMVGFAALKLLLDEVAVRVEQADEARKRREAAGGN